MLNDRTAGEYALRRALRATTQALGDVLRVADSRGARLPTPDETVGESDDHDDTGSSDGERLWLDSPDCPV